MSFRVVSCVLCLQAKFQALGLDPEVRMDLG